MISFTQKNHGVPTAPNSWNKKKICEKSIDMRSETGQHIMLSVLKNIDYQIELPLKTNSPIFEELREKLQLNMKEKHKKKQLSTLNYHLQRLTCNDNVTNTVKSIDAITTSNEQPKKDNEKYCNNIDCIDTTIDTHVEDFNCLSVQQSYDSNQYKLYMDNDINKIEVVDESTNLLSAQLTNRNDTKTTLLQIEKSILISILFPSGSFWK